MEFQISEDYDQLNVAQRCDEIRRARMLGEAVGWKDTLTASEQYDVTTLRTLSPADPRRVAFASAEAQALGERWEAHNRVSDWGTGAE